MIEVKNSLITLTRGDTCAIKVDVVDVSGNDYLLQDGDTLTFTVRKKVGSDKVLIKKVLDENILTLIPEDTISLEFGSYVYDIVLKTFAGEVFTIIPTSTFKVSQEVHTE